MIFQLINKLTYAYAKFDNMTSSKTMNVNEALSYLEDLCQSEETGEGQESSIFSASVCIQPPDDDQGKSDKDSGDDEAPDFSYLGRHQLLAVATFEIQDETGRKIIGNTNCNEVEEAVQNESRKRRRITNDSSSAGWRHMGMNRDTAGDWNIAPPSLLTEKSPCSFLKTFLHLNYTNLFVRKLLDMLTQMGSTISNFLLTN